MNGLKLFLVPVLMFVALVIGGKIVYDLKLLKADIKAFRTYVMSLPTLEKCQPPGQHVSNTFCSYKLEVTGVLDAQHGFYTGKIHPQVYKDNEAICEKARTTLRDDFKDLHWDCRKAPMKYPGQDTVYAFYVDNLKEVLKPSPGPIDFESVPYTNHLTKK